MMSTSAGSSVSTSTGASPPYPPATPSPSIGLRASSRFASDSVGVGMAWSWLNPNLFDRSSELMFQGYYQAHVVGGIFAQPTVSYIPTPGASSSLGGAWAISFRVAVLF